MSKDHAVLSSLQLKNLFSDVSLNEFMFKFRFIIIMLLVFYFNFTFDLGLK